MARIKLDNRRYDMDLGDLLYACQKGGFALIRGLLVSAIRCRRPSGLLLGRCVRVLSWNRLKLGHSVSIGANSYLDCHAVSGVRLQDNVTLREHTWIQCRSGVNEPGQGLDIGSGTYIGPFSVIGVGGPISIGSNCQIGARLTLAAESHQSDPDGLFTTGQVSRLGISIGSDCWFGNNVTVLDGVEIGDRVIIGAGAVVTKSIPAGQTVVGVPARPIATTFKEYKHG